MCRYGKFQFWWVFFLATLQTVGNGSLYGEMKVTVDSDPYYSSVFTVQMNKRPPSTDLSRLVSFYLQKETLLCKHVTYCDDNGSWLVFGIDEERKTGVKILHDSQLFFLYFKCKTELLFICA